jgi:hypothetical protein
MVEKGTSKPPTPETEVEEEVISPLGNEKIKRKMRRSKKSTSTCVDVSSLYNNSEELTTLQKLLKKQASQGSEVRSISIGDQA